MESRQVGNTSPATYWALKLCDLNKIELLSSLILLNLIHKEDNIIIFCFLKQKFSAYETLTDLWSPTEYSFFTVHNVGLFYYLVINNISSASGVTKV